MKLAFTIIFLVLSWAAHAQGVLESYHIDTAKIRAHTVPYAPIVLTSDSDSIRFAQTNTDEKGNKFDSEILYVGNILRMHNIRCRKLELFSLDLSQLIVTNCSIDTILCNSAKIGTFVIKGNYVYCLQFTTNLSLVEQNPYLASVDELTIDLSGIEFFLMQYWVNMVHVKRSVLRCANFNSLDSRRVAIDSVCFRKKLTMQDARLDVLSLHDLSIDESIDLSSSTIANQMLIGDIGGPELNLLRLNYQSHSDKPCELYLDGANIANIKIDYIHFDLKFDSRNYLGEVVKDRNDDMTFVNLLENQKLGIHHDGYQKLDLDYQYYRYWESDNSSFWSKCIYVFKWIWSDFGYAQWHIFFISISIFLIFAIINTKPLRFLIRKVYTIEKLDIQLEKEKQAGWFRKFVFSLIYTAIIFFGIKLEVDKMHFAHTPLVVYILAMFTIGLICAAFMFNAIVSG